MSRAADACVSVHLLPPSEPYPTRTNGQPPLWTPTLLMKSKLAYWFGWIGKCEECRLAYRIDLGELPVNALLLAFQHSWLWIAASCSAETHSRSIETAVKGLPASPSPHSTFPWRRKSELFTTWEVELRAFSCRWLCFAADGSHIQCDLHTMQIFGWKYLGFCFSILPSIHSMSSSIWNIPSGDVYHS